MTYVLLFLAVILLGLFKCFKTHGKGGFQIEGKKVMFYEYSTSTWKRSGKEVKGIDFETFEVLESNSNWLAKDKDYFYYRGKVHPTIDHSTGKYLGKDYFIDKDHVLYKARILKGANPKTFRLLKEGYACDDKMVYHVAKAIPNSDPKSFEIIDGNFARDKNTLYLEWQIVEGANPAGFKYLKKNRIIMYHTDGKSVFNRTKKMVGADLDSWEYIGYFYSKDKNHVYYSGRKVIGADPNTFEESSNKKVFDAQDANHKYKTGKRI